MDVGDFVGDGQHLTCNEAVGIAEAIGICNEIPHGTVSPHPLCNQLQGIATVNRVSSGHPSRAWANRFVVLVKVCTLGGRPQSLAVVRLITCLAFGQGLGVIGTAGAIIADFTNPDAIYTK